MLVLNQVFVNVNSAGWWIDQELNLRKCVDFFLERRKCEFDMAEMDLEHLEAKSMS